MGSSTQPIPALAQKQDFPCVAYQLFSSISEYTITSPNTPYQGRMLFSRLAQFRPGSYLVAHNLAVPVKAALSAYQGTLPGGLQVLR